jgi:hypothetical protein
MEASVIISSPDLEGSFSPWIERESTERVVGDPEGAAKLAANPAVEVPASRTCPVATVVIPDGRESDLSCRRLRSKSPSRPSASIVGSVRGASKSAGCSERSEPLAAKSRPTGSGLWWDR